MKHTSFHDADSAAVDPGAHGCQGAYRAKRPLDLCLSLLILPLVSPLIAVLWLIARCDGGAGFFAHPRIAQNGSIFLCWKIRTMVPDAEDRLLAHLMANPDAALEWRENFKLEDDPRVTRFGRFLRRTSLDELPQIWNVLSGDMSFVGPRPIVAAELDKYSPRTWAYFGSKPGITGVWQVSGRNDISYDMRVQMDAKYLDQASFWFDLGIMARTAFAVWRRTGC